MKYQIKAKKGRATEIKEVHGVKQLHRTLGTLRGRGLKVTDISRIMIG